MKKIILSVLLAATFAAPIGAVAGQQAGKSADAARLLASLPEFIAAAETVDFAVMPQIPLVADFDFAGRMSTALTAAPKAVTSAPKAASAPKVWTCGPWEALIQGSGRARACEWEVSK